MLLTVLAERSRDGSKIEEPAARARRPRLRCTIRGEACTRLSSVAPSPVRPRRGGGRPATVARPGARSGSKTRRPPPPVVAAAVAAVAAAAVAAVAVAAEAAVAAASRGQSPTPGTERGSAPAAWSVVGLGVGVGIGSGSGVGVRVRVRVRVRDRGTGTGTGTGRGTGTGTGTGVRVVRAAPAAWAAGRACCAAVSAAGT